MDSYLVLRFVHILSAVVVAGTGAGIAFFMFMASRSNNPQAIAVTARNVVLADWLFTAPAVVIQFLSGWLLMNKLNWSFSSQWFLTVLALFIFIGVCWIPVLFIQYRLRYYADQAVQHGALSDEFKRLMKLWTALGIPAFLAILVIFWLMVFKPLAIV